MKAEIIIIGNEVLFGYITDTNSSFLSSELLKLGIEVLKKTVIPDKNDEIVKSIREAFDRADIVILTGGLGPTHDDVTKKSISGFLKRSLILNDKVLLNVKAHFAKKGIVMPQVNTSQALVPQGATILDNPVGTAPGLLFEEEYGTIILLPGVPTEMKVIFNESVQPYLKKKVIGKVILSQTIHTTGITESELYERLKNIRKTEDIAFLPLFTGVDIRVTVESDTMENARDELSKISGSITDKIDDCYYGSDNETLERVIGILLSMRRKTLSVAESCTAGLFMKRITDVPGSSVYFLGGVVSYSNDVKIKILKIKQKILKLKGAVSSEVAKAMAEGVRNLMNSDYGVSTTGIAGPGGETENKPVGLVYIGISDAKETYSKDYHFTGTRDIIREQAAQAALDLLRRRLLGI
ncbi:competence/damage-inducible protein A [candidate division WOR-3 bacterium]|nr:competence/damage-inducible protein A [candidate division WOR-3 bacterium]